MKILNRKELDIRIDLNYKRLENDSYYQIDEVFSDPEYDWYGDKEGRALLAFVSHYKINGRKMACMDQLVSILPTKVNEKGYLGPIYEGMIHEQQLSGHSWLLRGLCEYYEQFEDAACLQMIRNITEHLYVSRKGAFVNYPVDREETGGAVSGNSVGLKENWILSSDIGCAFMSIDGLSHAYRLLKDEKIKSLLDEMISVYLAIDKVKLKAQTHCTLTSARGMIRMYQETKEQCYLEGARKILELYVYGGGMSRTYQNLNWWVRPDTWTEPCAIVDSLMVSLELYKITDMQEYRTIAARIYHNGLATAQRANGGAGTDHVVLDGVQPILAAQMYEAFFCCTMRLAEGLWYIDKNAELLYAETTGKISKIDKVYMDGDLIYAEVSEELEPYAEAFTEADGHKLCPIVKYYKVPDPVMKAGFQKVIFE